MTNDFVDFECKKCKYIISDIEHLEYSYSLRCPNCNNFITNVRIINNNKEYFNTKNFYYQDVLAGKIIQEKNIIVSGTIKDLILISESGKIFPLYISDNYNKYINQKGFYQITYDKFSGVYFILNKL